MDQSHLVSKLRQITGDLKPAPQSSTADLDDLRRNVAQALLNHGGLAVTGNGLLTSTAQVTINQQLAADEIAPLRLQPPAIEVPPLIFRRETPFRNNLLGTSVADWGVGLSPSKSFGPFLTEQGLPVWFDFFFAVRLVQVVFTGSADQILAIPVWGALRGNRSFKIEPGSVWIASTLVARDPELKGFFTGLKVRGGRLELSENAVINDGQIQIVPGSTAKLSLDLDQNQNVPPSADAGFDAEDAEVSLPKTFVIHFNTAGSSLEPSSASCKVFGCATELRPTGKPALWLAPFGQILIPFFVKTDSGDVFTVRSSRSKNFALAGEAKLENGSGWLVPAAKIDPRNFGQASGTGAIAIALSKGIAGEWTGLRGGPTRFEHPAIVVEPNMVSFIDFFAANVYGRQKWTLWENGKSPHHSEVVLSFDKAFPFLFVSSSAGAEALTYFCSHKDSLDRPIDGNGHPFNIESSAALASLVQIGAGKFAALFDADLLLDSPNRALVFERSSIVLRNAFFSVSQPYNLLLFGTLLDNEDGDVILKSGVLTLTYAIFSYIPTLPDPYVSNYEGISARSQGLTPGFHTALAGFVQWPSPAQDQPADGSAQVYFRFVSANPSQLAPAAKERTALSMPARDAAGFRPGPNPAARDFRTGLRTLNQDLTGNSATISLPVAASGEVWNPLRSELSRSAATFSSRIENAVATGAMNSVLEELERNPLLAHIPDKRALVNDILNGSVAQPTIVASKQQEFASFLKQPDVSFRDFFMLLDVSSNADQMGVSLGNAIRVEQGRNGETKLQTTIADISVTASAAANSPLQIEKMDVVAPANFLRAMTLPQISWEPFFNIPLAIEGTTAPDQITVTPGLMLFDDDGPPTWIASTSPLPVPIAPLPVTGNLIEEFRNERQPQLLRTYFGLPFGMVAQADFQPKPASELGAASDVSIHVPHFDQVRGGLQIKAQSLNPAEPLPGFTSQQDKLKWFLGGKSITGSTLGSMVRDIFEENFDHPTGQMVPLERIEFCGYGASIFSDWHNDKPTVADVSQVKFEVLLGRTAHEVVQIRSILFPFGVHVVRTVTLMRSASGYVFRSDSGWKPESDGFFDFSYDIRMQDGSTKPAPDLYVFHSGTVKGVSRVREIKDFFDAGVYTSSFPALECGVSEADLRDLFNVAAAGPLPVLPVKLEPVVFDADVHLDNVTSGGALQPGGDFVVQSRKMLGYVQIEPAHVLIPPRIFADLLASQNGSLGGPVDCVIDINRSRQRMRLSRVDVSSAVDAGGKTVFVTAERGSLLLPKDGSWSVVQQRTDTGDVDPLEPGRAVPLIQANGDTALRLANPADVVQPSSKRNYGVLQSTGTQKLLFASPTFLPGTPKISCSDTFFADAYKLLNAKGPFPNVANALALPSAQRQLEILGEGLLKFKQATLDLRNLLPPTYSFPFIDVKDVVKIYAEYGTKTTDPNKGMVDLGIDSAALNPGDRWKAALSNIRVVVDLGPFERLMWVEGNFDAASSVDPKYNKPNLQFGPALDTAKDILQVLARLSGNDFDSGMSVGMSNSPDNWEYKFNCSQEIPVIKFPSPDELVLDPNPPLKLEAGLRVGFYFNEMLSVPTDLKQLVPACGAYVDFYGRIEVVCLSLAIASVYGVGQVNLGIVGDTKAGKLLKMRFGFGAEVVVGLPVVLNVSVLYVVGIQLDLGDTGVTVGASLMFRGSADICGGLVSIGIQIEAAGSVKRDGKSTNCIAQVTFAIDVTVAWVIDIDETYQWQETRQIA